MAIKLDVLVLSAHPDDAELACAGTIISHVEQGRNVGVVDLTQGEMGTRGTPQIRAQEAEAAAAVMGLVARENLALDDVWFTNNQQTQLVVAQAIRKYRPEIILTNAIHDRHPDHGKAARLVVDANFVAGLAKVTTTVNGQAQQPWRAKVVYHFIQSLYITPEFVVDVSPWWARKIEAIQCYTSQFFNPNSNEPETYISRPQFMQLIESRGVEFGNAIGVNYAEGYTTTRHIGVSNLFHLI